MKEQKQLFLAMQYPSEITGVTNADFIFISNEN